MASHAAFYHKLTWLAMLIFTQKLTWLAMLIFIIN